MVNFVMLNPSTADAEKDDPTIRKCTGFARAWGYAILIVTNLFAYRSSTPDALYSRSYDEIVGPDNNAYLEHVAKTSDRIVCAWGNHGDLHGRGRMLRRTFKANLPKVDLTYLVLNASGEPSHPLYQSSTLVPRKWT